MPPKLTLSRPKDESFEAYKKWILNLGKKLGAKDTPTDEKLRASWQKFWAKAKGSKKKE